MLAVLTLAGAYLLGSIPFSFLVARLWGVADVRNVGSGNVGATNVMRSAGKAPGVLAFLLDFAKGLAATELGLHLGTGRGLPALAALTAVLGHMYPVWLGFRGGKGVSTGAGAFLPLAPAATAAGLAGFLAAVAATRFVSMGSIVGALTLAAATFAFDAAPAVSWAAVAVAVLVVFRHRGNVERILRGTESRLGRPRPARPAE